ncbi:MAG: hypothetical protein ACOC2R_03930 [Spirochaetota bacterium]
MSGEQAKAEGFVRHLLENPALRNQTPLQKEEQLLAFLELNARALYPTLASGRFFPGKSWPEIRSLLTNELFRITDTALQGYLNRLIIEQLEMSFTAFLGAAKIPQEEMKTELWKLTTQVIHTANGRRALTGCFNALAYRLAEKYIEELFQSRNYIRFELEKVQRLKMSKEELKQMLKVSLLIRPAVYLVSSAAREGPATLYRHRGCFQPGLAEKVTQGLARYLPHFPEPAIRSGVESNISFIDNSRIAATARLTLVLSNLAHEYKPNMQVDRGAVSPEKSWFSIARRNYRYFGYDIKMIDELYKIAAERGW